MSFSSLVELMFPVCSPRSTAQWALVGLGLAGSLALAWLMVRRKVWPFNRATEAIHWQEPGGKGRWSLSAGTKVGIGVLVYLGLLFGFEHRIKSSEPYRMAIAIARASQRVQDVLGASFEEGWFVEAEMRDGPEGFAVLSIPLKGKERRSALKVRADKEGRRWRITALSLELGQCGDPPEVVTLIDTVRR